MSVTLVLAILEVVQRAPAAVDAISAWLKVTPDPTPEQVIAMLQEYRNAGDARLDEVAEFNRLKDVAKP